MDAVLTCPPVLTCTLFLRDTPIPVTSHQRTARGFAAVSSKIHWVTLSPRPRVLLSRHCTVVFAVARVTRWCGRIATEQELVATNAEIQNCSYRQRTRSCQSMDVEILLKNGSMATATLLDSCIPCGQESWWNASTGSGALDLHHSGRSGH